MSTLMCNYPYALFRYSNKWFLDPFRSEGRIFLRPASYYKDSALTDAQQDDELARTSHPDPSRHHILVTPASGGEQKLLSDMVNVSIRFDLKDRDGKFYDYYLFCTSLVHDSSLYPEFRADSCVRITDVKAFADRFVHTCREEFGDSRVYSAAVTYFNPTEPLVVKTNLDLVFRKNRTKYAAQQEYRFAVLLDPSVKLKEKLLIEIGSIMDITEYEVPS